MDVTQVLVGTQSADQNIRVQAEQQLEGAKQSNLPLLMSLLATELANEQKDLHVRQAAGLYLKNCLTAKDETSQEELSQKWLTMDAAAKTQIKTTTLSALGSTQAKARHTAAQGVAAMGTIDLPHNQWPDLVQGLVKNVTDSGNPALKQSSLEALGYICEEIEPETLADQSNLILTAVIQGMRKEETSEDVRLAATNALLNALEFVRTNFDNDGERDYIMQTVCETTQAERKEIRVASFECIVRVAELYYDKLTKYMQSLYQLTLQSITKASQDVSEDDVGQQAVEFWSTICDEEIELMEEEEEAKEQGQPPARASQNYVRGAVPFLVPLLLEALCKRGDEDDVDEDAWDMSMAASTCLSRVAQTVCDEVTTHVMPYIEKHIQSTDWRRREAATLSFGSILEGPSESLTPYMQQAMDVMIKLMRDPCVPVKDTAAWTIGRICEHHISSISQQHWQQMMRPLQPGQPAETEGVLLTGLKDDPRVANNVCWVLHNLADHCESTRSAATNVLSPLFVDLARALLACTERPDAGENNLRCSAYEALNTTLTNAADDTKVHIEQLLPVILQRLEASFQMQIVSNDDREAQTELQGLLCGCLQVMTQKLGEQALPHLDRMMQTFLQVFGAKNSTVHEEALMAVGAVANASEAHFEKYMPHFRPFLSLGLSNFEEHQVCAVAVGVVGDICRALESKVLPYCDEVVGLLLRNLQNPALNRDVKPPILSCFGDIALAIGGQFEKYLPVTMTMLDQAAQTSVNPTNGDLIEYLNSLREGIFEAYTGVLQGLRADNKAEAFVPYVEGAMTLLHKVAQGTSTPQTAPGDTLLQAAVGVVGDLATTLGPRFKQMAKQSPHKEALRQLLKEARQSSCENTQQVARWAQQAVYGA